MKKINTSINLLVIYAFIIGTSWIDFLEYTFDDRFMQGIGYGICLVIFCWLFYKERVKVKKAMKL